MSNLDFWQPYSWYQIVTVIRVCHPSASLLFAAQQFLTAKGPLSGESGSAIWKSGMPYTINQPRFGIIGTVSTGRDARMVLSSSMRCVYLPALERPWPL